MKLLAMVHSYCNQHGIETNMELKSASPKRQRKEPSEKKTDKIPSGIVSLNLYQKRKNGK